MADDRSEELGMVLYRAAMDMETETNVHVIDLLTAALEVAVRRHCPGMSDWEHIRANRRLTACEALLQVEVVHRRFGGDDGTGA